MPTTPLSVRVPDELLEILDAKAEELECSRTDYVLAILAESAGITLQPRTTVDTFVDKRLQMLEERIAVLEEQSQSNVSLSAKKLASRLGVSYQSIYNHRDDLIDWSREQDPDGWAWRWDGENYRPVG
ncbi:ribbon-helix-helix protein, CopG family [Hassallia byssoidea VB512170]|uniref:Ribbon-helix-helix protein, CopG family n=1 Tax=Hassallia byssoidea VB512170 TaxID=1304833 RepID=A0A846HJK2_9CYAN|nr:ribbon-helix-helix protein, CopG family [Hassalia byssoidea]NEU77029.1 ribbon-helix-helix protein, CopG family [Hassalia byssoidea VB512170]